MEIYAKGKIQEETDINKYLSTQINKRKFGDTIFVSYLDLDVTIKEFISSEVYKNLTQNISDIGISMVFWFDPLLYLDESIQDYLIFISIYHNEDLYLIYDDELKMVRLVNKNGLINLFANDLLSNTQTGTISIIKTLINGKSSFNRTYECDRIPKKEGSPEENISNFLSVFKDILDFSKKSGSGSGKLKIDVHKGAPMYMEGIINTKDMNKYKELEEYISDYGSIAVKKHAGKKVGIKGEKQFKYKRNTKDGKKQNKI